MVHHMHEVHFYTWSMNANVWQRERVVTGLDVLSAKPWVLCRILGGATSPWPLYQGFHGFPQIQMIPLLPCGSLWWSEAPPGESSQPFHRGLVTHTAQPPWAWKTCLDFSLVLNLHMTASTGNNFHHSQLGRRPCLSWPGQARCVSAPWHRGNVTALSRVQEVLGECHPCPAQPKRTHVTGRVPHAAFPAAAKWISRSQCLGHTTQHLSSCLQGGWQQKKTPCSRLSWTLLLKTKLACGEETASQSSTMKYRPIFPVWQLQTTFSTTKRYIRMS